MKINCTIQNVVIGALLMFLAGCKEEDYRLNFSHNLHVVDNGLECSDCHGTPGDPSFNHITHETCAMCHDEPNAKEISEKTCGMCHQKKQLPAFQEQKGEEKKAEEQKAGAEQKQETYTSSLTPKRHVFVHTKALAGKCKDCHGNVLDKDLKQVPKLTRADVLRIRNNAHASGQDCTMCHVGVARDQKPDSHSHAWLKRHGLFGAQSDAACSVCHTEDSCRECHSTMKPASHNNLWRLKTHGVEAAWNRQSCNVCHTEDSCVACHSQTKPLSHTGRWAAPGFRPTHCISCHNTSSPGDGCATCHENGNDVSLHEKYWGGAAFDHSQLTGQSCYTCHWTKTP